MSSPLQSPIPLGIRPPVVYEFPDNPELTLTVTFVVAIALGTVCTMLALELWRRWKRRQP